MKPIIRWTIGNVSKLGIKCLHTSVNLMLNIYGDKFDYYICHNSIDLNKIRKLERYARFIDQKKITDCLSIKPVENCCCWKFYPPRINIKVHEIFIDNDLIIHEEMPAIEEFLKSDDLFMVTEGHQSYYGKFQNKIKKDFMICAGFFGLPPNFNFSKHLNENFNILKEWKSASYMEKVLKTKILTLDEWDKRNLEWFDEQGLMAFILQNKKLKVVPMSEVQLGPIKGKYGTHLCGANLGLKCDEKVFKKYFKSLLNNQIELL